MAQAILWLQSVSNETHPLRVIVLVVLLAVVGLIGAQVVKR
jgi:hypothetical protein